MGIEQGRRVVLARITTEHHSLADTRCAVLELNAAQAGSMQGIPYLQKILGSGA